MLQSGEADMSHWSHYEEYLRSRVIQKTRAKFASFNDVVVGLIQADPHFRAQDVRDRLPKVCEGPTRTVRRFAEGKLSFEDAYEAALDAGADNTALRKLNKFRQWLADAGTARVLTSAEGQDHDKIAYELDKIRVRIVQLQNTLSRAGKKLR
jgi:hypothetical protein